MCGLQKASIYVIYIYAISVLKTTTTRTATSRSREQNQLKRRFKTCVSVKTGLTQPQPSASPPRPTAIRPPVPRPAPRHGSSIPQFPIQHGQFSSASHAKNTAAKTLNDSNDGDGALQLTNRQWDRQANRRSDSGTGTQHTLGQLHTNTHTHTHTTAGGKQSQLGGCTRYQSGYPGMGAAPAAAPAPAPSVPELGALFWWLWPAEQLYFWRVF